MILALDTDVLVHWQMAGAPWHERVATWLRDQVQSNGCRLGLTPQVVQEFLHVVTDPRRFAAPMTMNAAIRRVRDLWDAPEVERITPGPDTLHRTLALLQEHDLGRRRILDTSLAATLQSAGVSRLATLNGRDYGCFQFLEVVAP